MEWLQLHEWVWTTPLGLFLIALSIWSAGNGTMPNLAGWLLGLLLPMRMSVRDQREVLDDLSPFWRFLSVAIVLGSGIVVLLLPLRSVLAHLLGG